MKLLKTFLLFFLLLQFSTLHAQKDALADSILALIPAAPDTMKVKYYNKLCWHYIYNQTDLAISYGKKAALIAEKIDWEAGRAGAYNRIGIGFDVKENLDSALFYYDLALRAGEKLGNKTSISSTLNNIGLVKWKENDFNAAIEVFFKALGVFEEIGDLSGQANCLNNIALVYADLSDFKLSEEYQRQAIKIRLKSGDSYGASSSMSNLSSVLLELNQADSAYFYITRAIALKKTVNDRYGLMNAYKILGIILAHQDNFTQSIAAYDSALTLSYELNSRYERASIFNNKAIQLANVGDLKGALLLADSAIILSQSTGNPRLRALSTKYKAITLNKMGRSEEAVLTMRTAKAISDSLFTSEKALQINELETRYRTTQKIQENLKLQQENEIIRLKAAKNQTLLWFSGISFLMVLFSGSLIYGRARAMKRARHRKLLLRETERNLDAVVAAIEMERKRIASELDNRIKHPLLNLQQSWDQLEKEESPENQQIEKKERLQRLKKIATEAAEDLSRIVEEMMPPLLTQRGLAAAIQDMLETSFRNSPIQYRFEQQNAGGRFAESLETGLYRICQELVSNVIKHSKATHISVQLIRRDNALLLIVSDNGKGFDPEEKRDGIGLMNIAGRLSSENGSVEFKSGNPQGTIATIKIPLNE